VIEAHGDYRGAGAVTAPIGAEVGIYVDMRERLEVGDVLQTTAGRRYGVAKIRVQTRGKHVGRQHLRVIVLDRDTPCSGAMYAIHWYPRRRRARR
jgi:hypothetical protein